jgi:hypothetical protein
VYILPAENSEKVFQLKNIRKIGIFHRKNFEKLFSHEIRRKIPRKKSYEKSAPAFHMIAKRSEVLQWEKALHIFEKKFYFEYCSRQVNASDECSSKLSGPQDLPAAFLSHV